MKKILVIIDMQNDFISGTLGSGSAKATLPEAADKIAKFDGDGIYVTLDTHYGNYSDTLEGKMLPVSHCIEGSEGHRLDGTIERALEKADYTVIKKNTFGSFELAKAIGEKYTDGEFEIELCGLCTDICVVSNALILRAAYPNTRITVDSRCCAGVTEEKHTAALTTMESCQIEILR